jgi:hypothetical protein
MKLGFFSFLSSAGCCSVTTGAGAGAAAPPVDDGVGVVSGLGSVGVFPSASAGRRSRDDTDLGRGRVVELWEARGRGGHF